MWCPVISIIRCQHTNGVETSYRHKARQRNVSERKWVTDNNSETLFGTRWQVGVHKIPGVGMGALYWSTTMSILERWPGHKSASLPTWLGMCSTAIPMLAGTRWAHYLSIFSLLHKTTMYAQRKWRKVSPFRQNTLYSLGGHSTLVQACSSPN